MNRVNLYTATELNVPAVDWQGIFPIMHTRGTIYLILSDLAASNLSKVKSRMVKPQSEEPP